jgi:23S rRNA (cytosine1962-C5)-methyltransferase
VAATSNRKLVVSRRDVVRVIQGGHPWIYRDALDPLAGVAAGEIVEVVERGGRFLAHGYADPGSPIAVRVLSRDPDAEVDAALIAARVAAARALRARLVDPRQTNCFRLLNGEGDLLPGVVCDVYAGVHVMRFDGDGARVFGLRVAQALAAIGAPTVYERTRDGGTLLVGTPPPADLRVREHGMALAVNVLAGQKTGLFLDQRENRQLVRQHARGLRVLNCFAYTGGFSVAAALGGAVRTLAVDTAAAALESARLNLQLNGLPAAVHETICEDAFEFLDRAARRGEQFGLVILDPPSFAPSAASLENALRGYRELNTLGLRCVEPGGLFATASCSSHVTADAFLDVLAQAARRARRELRVFAVTGAGPDHPIAPAHPEGRYLKFVLGAV